MNDSLKHFANSFGINENSLPVKTREEISKHDFRTEEVVGIEKDELILNIIKKIQNDTQIIASTDRKRVWEVGWAENLSRFDETNGNLDSIIPKFIRGNNIIRWFGKYCRTPNSNFELDFTQVLRTFIFEEYLSDISSIYEFGAGTGVNLFHFAQLNKDLNLFGTDFVQPSVDLINRLAEKYGLNIKSSLFDMLNPPNDYELIAPNSAFVTFGSLEQLGGRIEPFIDYVIKVKPKIVINIEPMVEMYNQDSLEDFLASWFQNKRGYTSGFVKKLSTLEKESKISILKLKRLNFGSLMLEGFNLAVWKPH